MKIETTRFGPLDIDGDRLLRFPQGLLGFAEYRDYVLLEAGPGSEQDAAPGTPTFWWLQSVEVPDLAFVVTDPLLFVPTYRVPVHPQQLADLGVSSLDEAQVLVIVNKQRGTLTGNLQGPLIINLQSREGQQMVLSDRRYTTRVPLVELPSPVETAQPAALAG
ncbi:MAG: flagellar assembly protein FliW [Planctomycetota bacterium]